ncbi:MAG: contractile injection system tape measure protein, partial [Bacteroidota bacterium]
MSTTHHIQSQQIQLSFQGSEREAFGLQEQMSQHFQREMIPVMEQVFDRLVGPDRHLQLDQLEIDLGQWGAESWSGDDFLRRFAERLESALKTQLGTRNELANFSQQSNNVFQAWLHFLEKGVLPWHKRKLDQADYLFIAEQLSTQANPRDQLRRLL